MAAKTTRPKRPRRSPFVKRSLLVKASHALQQAAVVLIVGSVHYGIHHLLCGMLLIHHATLTRLIEIFAHTIFILIYIRLSIELFLIFFPEVERWMRDRLDRWGEEA